MSHDLELKKLQYRSAHRGCKETDIVFARYVEQHLHLLTPQECAIYAQLLDEDDAQIMDWLFGYTPPPPKYKLFIGQLIQCIPAQI